MRIKNPLRGIVKGNREVAESEQTDESWRSRPPLSTPEAVAPLPVAETKVPEPEPEPTLSVEAACAMMKAFPAMASETRRQGAIRTAILAKAEGEALLAEAAHEKARYAAARTTQEKHYEAQLAQIVAAVDALWEKRDRLNEYHQRAMLDVEARLETLDQLIYCLTHDESDEVAAPEPTPAPEPVALEEEPMVVVLPFKPSTGDSEDESDEARPSNRRRLYQKAA